MDRTAGEQVWLELPPISASAPRRLLVFLHGAGSSPENFAPVAIAWQLKFPGATAVLLQGLRRFGARRRRTGSTATSATRAVRSASTARRSRWPVASRGCRRSSDSTGATPC